PKVLGRLVVRSSGAGEVESKGVPFRLGETIEVAGGYKVEVLEATADFRFDATRKEEITDPRPIEDQVPDRPAVRVKIHGPEGAAPETRLLLEALDWSAHGQQAKFQYKEL